MSEGTTLRWKIIKKLPFKLRILVRCMCRVVELRDEISFERTTIGEVRHLLQNQIGIPVSAFTLKQLDKKRMLFDSYSLDDYQIVEGDTLILEVSM